MRASNGAEFPERVVHFGVEVAQMVLSSNSSRDGNRTPGAPADQARVYINSSLASDFSFREGSLVP